MASSISSSKHLLNRTVFAACSAKKMAELVAGLEALGGKVLPIPLIEAQDIEDKRPLDEALASLSKYAWIVFTSAYGVSFFFQRLQERGIKRHILESAKICAVGPATAVMIKEYGFEVALIPERYVAEGVLEALELYHGGLKLLAGSRILLPRAKEARDVMPSVLAAAGVQVDVVPCYQTVKAKLDETTIQQLQTKTPDLIVFTSSSTVRNLMELLGPDIGKLMLDESAVAAIGPITANTVESFGKRVEILPKENTIASLIDAIKEYFSRQ